MFEKIKQKLFGLKRVAGVEAVHTTDGKLIYNLVILSYAGGVVSIEKEEKGIEDVEKIKQLAGDETPVVLNVTGKGVLHKKVVEIDSDDNLISQVLPNAKETDFYIQKFVSGNSCFVSIIRRDSFNKIRILFNEYKLPVIHATLGPIVVAEIIPFIQGPNEEIVLPGFTLSCRNNVITDMKPGAEVKDYFYQLGEDKISSACLVPYAVAFKLFMGNSEDSGLIVEEIRRDSEEFYNKVIFKVGGYSVLAFFVGLMLMNYILYNYYQSENNELSSKSSNYENVAKEMAELEKKVEEKEYFLKKAGWLNLPKTSYYADQIAATIPSSIRLSQIKINPLNDKQSKKERKQIFKADTIYVVGSCSNPIVLNPWMKELKTKSWVQEANNVNYVHDHKTRSGMFEVEITTGNGF